MIILALSFMVLTIVVGSIRGTLSLGVWVLILLGFAFPLFGLIALVVTLAKASRTTREMRAAIIRMSENFAPSPEEVEFQRQKALFLARNQK